uniref:Uncharacterized protein n=1 Tax=Globodera rostochiensis TaxID=31243 RepID=A0A914IEY8_GLORO
MLNIDKRTLGLWEMKSKGLTGINKNYTEVEKQEIIAEFDKLKNEFKARYKGMPYENINEKIVQKLGVSLRTINLWKKQLGVSKPQKKHTDAEKVELLKKCCKIKKENPPLRKYEIAKMLNIDKTTLSLWERESKGIKPENRKKHAEAKKAEFMKQFYKIEEKNPKMNKEEIAQRQFGVSKKRKNHTDTEKVELLKNFNKIKKENPQLRTDEIAQMLNIHITTLNLWDKKYKIILKPDIKNFYSEVEKQGIVAEFDGLKNDFKTRANGMSYDMKKIDEKIAQKLGVSRRTIYYWKRQIGVSMDNGGPIDNVQRHVGFERSTSSAIL